jgi:dihydroflavonol-4-reductase
MVADPSTGFKYAFVTGATGIVGVPLCRKLIDENVKVTAYSRTPGRFDFPSNVDPKLGDILDREKLGSAAEGCDVIFHVAAAVHGSAKTLAEFERINVRGTENVISVARDNGAKMVHVSSVNVAGFRSGELADPYAETKSRAEELVVEAVQDGLDAVIVRPATVFGDEAGRAGLIVDRLLAGSLKVLPAPSRMISPVWSGDLADALVAAARIGESGRTYTVAGPSMKTRQFVDAVCESAGLPRPMLTLPALLFAVPLQLAWWAKRVTRWTPSVSVESLLHGSTHDGTRAVEELGFEYTAIENIFVSAVDK